MIVADTSALISLATADSLSLVLEEFDIHTTESVIKEVEDTAGYDDVHGTAARNVLDRRRGFTVHTVQEPDFTSSRVDSGEATCILCCRKLEADFLISDDLRALPELQNLTTATVAISPIVLNALVKRDVLENEDAVDRVETLAENRDWLESPIYRRARDIFTE
ncbi:hypothetical protein [Natrarchaeobius oligotrophus]|uniref:PIN domain-containing protein n=1 Tax=Natrarchaeobius chitinivorans TaxID=1679083 RepID=A0A3N6MJL1_NATCH|nr:hypothetical protein [Natrarchaeobius chitinivorans]RQH01475.1 hypothetical protein EA472_08565 [Natrarchaeobius chitinivorans]